MDREPALAGDAGGPRARGPGALAVLGSDQGLAGSAVEDGLRCPEPARAGHHRAVPLSPAPILYVLPDLLGRLGHRHLVALVGRAVGGDHGDLRYGGAGRGAEVLAYGDGG